VRGAFFAVTVLVFAVSGAAAQQLSAEERAKLEAQRQQLFEQMLRKPSELDTMFAYADVAARLGDNEAAVSTLERMLLFNPDLPRVQLELGALYFRLGSFETARTYLLKAADANPPPEVRARIDQYLAQIEKEISPHHLTGNLFAGLQFQSDANVAPGSSLVHSPIGDVLLSSQFVKHPDKNLFANANLLYSYDLGTQNRDTIDVTGTAFANHYFRFNRLDLDLGELTVGPRFNFPEGTLPGVQTASVKPYAIFNEVGLGENQYFYTLGTGLEYGETVWEDLKVKSIVEFRHKSFSNAPDRPVSTGLDGDDVLVSLLASKPVPFTPNSALTVEADFLNQDTKFQFYANRTYAISAAYSIRFPDPLEITTQPAEATFFVGRSWALYEAPDPCCNTSGSAVVFSPSTRYDRRWRLGFSYGWAVNADTALVLQAQRDIVSSNLPLYGFTSNSILVGPQFRF
jgi:tetratricopeptide (TPR) repeat protein